MDNGLRGLHLIEPVGLLRWREWGHPPEPTAPAFWIDNARREAGRDSLPFTLIALDPAGTPVGVVGLGDFDQDDLRDHTPWVMGMLVSPARRAQGIGQALLEALELHAAALGHHRLWVATTTATGFYLRCGWQLVGPVTTAAEGPMTVLTRTRGATSPAHPLPPCGHALP
ncbi:GNAT family N-acetyltransferase [Actinoplanes sp. CA-142083]|uniref:GNAT family N-acetyltransferase n=1 Tax=Actinoplanes sp. CA-142083 TaxID=3239903 RepID=UPI003D8FDCF6